MNLVTYHTANGFRVALVGEPARTLMPVITIEEGAGVVLHKVPATEARHMRPVVETTKADPMRRFRAAFRRLGGNAAARAVLFGGDA